MDFRVSALKWRPQKFSQLVGQENIIRTLSNAISLDRVGHAYLFSGTRGVGKTTTARIFAKALNCKKGPVVDPCDACSFCVEIRQGNSVDVLEVDGASNNGVAEVRDLINNVQYAASACRFKIYIIDEVHMLSRSAFNALLKTLEEPPAHVVFIFATTELLKIPETIISRCQCFEFKPMTRGQVIEQLRLICEEEGITIDAPSLGEIAKNGGGSMRDSQSLLDQVSAFAGKEIRMDAVETVLGIVERDVLKTFIDDLIACNAGALIALVTRVVDAGKDLNYFCRDLVEYVRNLLVLKVAKAPEILMDPQACDIPVLKVQAEKFDVDELHQIFTVFSRTESEMKRASLPKIVFEMALLRLTDVRPFKSIDAMIEKINRMGDEVIGSSSVEQERQVPSSIENANPTLFDPPESGGKDNPKAELSVSSSHQMFASSVEVQAPVGENFFLGKDVRALWDETQSEICAQRNSFGHFFEDCQVSLFPPAKLRLEFADPFTRDLVNKEENKKIILETVALVFGGPLELELSVRKNGNRGTAEIPPESDEKKTVYNNKKNYHSAVHIIQDALDIFGGKVIR